MIMFGCKEAVGKKMKIHKSVLWNNLNLHNCVSLGRSQKFLFGGPTYDTNLLAYINFHKHAQTQISIHTYNLVSSIVNL